MILYLGQPLTPAEEVIYLNAVLRSVVEISQELRKILEMEWGEGEMANRFAQVILLNQVIDSEWRRWLRLYDQGQKYAWPVLPMAIPDIYNQR